jgi:hypothetical protein
MSNNILNDIDHTEDASVNEVENAPITIPEIRVQPMAVTAGKITGTGVVTKTDSNNEVRVDGRSAEILDLLRSAIHGFKGTERAVESVEENLKTVIANQRYLLERLFRVLELMGKEGIDFKLEADDLKKEIESTVREGTEAIRKFAETPEAVETKVPKKGKPVGKRGTAGYIMLEALYRSGNRAMPRTELIKFASTKTANPYPSLTKLSTCTPALVTITDLTVALTPAGIQHVESEMAAAAKDIVEEAQKQPDSVAFSPVGNEIPVCDKGTEIVEDDGTNPAI